MEKKQNLYAGFLTSDEKIREKRSDNIKEKQNRWFFIAGDNKNHRF